MIVHWANLETKQKRQSFRSMHGADDVMSVLSSGRSLLNILMVDTHRFCELWTTTINFQARTSRKEICWSIRFVHPPFVHPPTGPGPFYSHEDTEVVRLKAVGLEKLEAQNVVAKCFQTANGILYSACLWTISQYKHKPGTHLLRFQKHGKKKNFPRIFFKQNEKSNKQTNKQTNTKCNYIPSQFKDSPSSPTGPYPTQFPWPVASIFKVPSTCCPALTAKGTSNKNRIWYLSDLNELVKTVDEKKR